MSNDHIYTIKISVEPGSAERLERMLFDALGDNPSNRKVVLNYRHLRNLGPACAGKYDKSVEEILQELTLEFPSAEVDMSWENEFGGSGEGFSYDITPRKIDRFIAQRFLEFPNRFDFSEATEITDEAAEVLSTYDAENYDGGYHKELKLNGLTELSDAAAKSLAKYQYQLELCGLTELSDSIAESLSHFNGVRLSLSGLKILSDSAAESLSKLERVVLDLDGLTKVSDAVAVSLSKVKGSCIHLEGVTELSDAAAESLSRCGDLWLKSIKTISVRGAQILLNSDCLDWGDEELEAIVARAGLGDTPRSEVQE